MLKKLFHIVFAVLFLFILSGCLKTLFPIFHEEDAVFNTSLVGYWKCSDKGNSNSFMEFKKITDDRKQELPAGIRKISDKGYLVTRLNNQEEITSQHFVFLVKIGKYYYLDYFPTETISQKNINKIYKDHFIKLHSNYRVDFKGNDHFEMKLFDQGFLDKLISKNQINIRHEIIGDDNFITASTDDLQKFIRQYSDNPEAFGDDI
ncbi:MAG: hypothetical protein WBO39_15425, partial [Ferruginibacter sp.]